MSNGENPTTVTGRPSKRARENPEEEYHTLVRHSARENTTGTTSTATTRRAPDGTMHTQITEDLPTQPSRCLQYILVDPPHPNPPSPLPSADYDYLDGYDEYPDVHSPPIPTSVEYPDADDYAEDGTLRHMAPRHEPDPHSPANSQVYDSDDNFIRPPSPPSSPSPTDSNLEHLEHLAYIEQAAAITNMQDLLEQEQNAILERQTRLDQHRETARINYAEQLVLLNQARATYNKARINAALPEHRAKTKEDIYAEFLKHVRDVDPLETLGGFGYGW
jgi:hypothetical protein